MINTVIVEWRPFDNVAINHKPLTAREQWENSKHRSMWLVEVNCNMGKWDGWHQED